MRTSTIEKEMYRLRKAVCPESMLRVQKHKENGRFNAILSQKTQNFKVITRALDRGR